MNFNIAIKKIALLAGWNEEIGVTRSKRGERVERFTNEKKVYYRFCDLIASHAMRRTAITAKNGIIMFFIFFRKYIVFRLLKMDYKTQIRSCK